MQSLECHGCHLTFPFTAGEQAYYKRNNIDTPTICQGCRSRSSKVSSSKLNALASESPEAMVTYSTTPSTPIVVSVPSLEHPTLYAALDYITNSQKYEDGSMRGKYEVHLASGIHQLNTDTITNISASGSGTGSGESNKRGNEKGVGFLFKRNKQHIVIKGVGLDVHATATATATDTDTTTVTTTTSTTTGAAIITSDLHSLFQVSGRSTHLELQNLHLLHTCYNEDKSRIGACVFGLGKAQVTVTNCTMNR